MGNIAEKLLIDVEKTNNLSAYYIRSEDGKEIETIASGKMIISITENEHKNKIYKLLEDNCDLIFCTTDKLRNFAETKKENVFLEDNDFDEFVERI